MRAHVQDIAICTPAKKLKIRRVYLRPMEYDGDLHDHENMYMIGLRKESPADLKNC